MNNRISAKKYLLLILVLVVMLGITIINYFINNPIQLLIFGLLSAVFFILSLLFEPKKNIKIRITDDFEINIG